MSMPASERPSRALRLGILLAGLAVLAGLAAFAYAGTFSRLWTDDFCYSGEIQTNGFFNGTLDWLQTGGNRYAALWGVGVMDLFGTYAVRAMPAVVLVLWVLTGWWALYAAQKRLKIQFVAGGGLLLALALVFVAVFAAPHRLQTLYWRMGTLHYTLPLVFFLGMVALTLRAWPAAGKALHAPETAALTALLAFVAAGASETYAAFQTGALLLALAVFLAVNRRGAWSAGLPLLLTPLLTSLAGMAVMALAPANAWRQTLMPPPDNLGVLISYTLRYTFDFYVQTLTSTPLPLAVWLAVCAAAGLLLRHAWNVKRLLGMAAAALLIGAGLAACAIAPSVYAGLQYPAGRALNVAWFALLSGLGAASLLAAAALKAAFPARWWGAAALLLALGCGAYTVRGIPAILDEAQTLAVKAARWDARQALILTSRAQGDLDVIVPEVDVVSSLEDLGADTDYWINACMANYYQVDGLQALPEE